MVLLVPVTPNTFWLPTDSRVFLRVPSTTGVARNDVTTQLRESDVPVLKVSHSMKIKDPVWTKMNAKMSMAAVNTSASTTTEVTNACVHQATSLTRTNVRAVTWTNAQSTTPANICVLIHLDHTGVVALRVTNSSPELTAQTGMNAASIMEVANTAARTPRDPSSARAMQVTDCIPTAGIACRTRNALLSEIQRKQRYLVTTLKITNTRRDVP